MKPCHIIRKFGKILPLIRPLVTSILTSEKNYPNVFCSAFPNLPNAVFRFSLTCVVFEIVGGGAEINPPPPGVGVRPKPPGVRGLRLRLNALFAPWYTICPLADQAARFGRGQKFWRGEPSLPSFSTFSTDLGHFIFEL